MFYKSHLSLCIKHSNRIKRKDINSNKLDAVALDKRMVGDVGVMFKEWLVKHLLLLRVEITIL